MNRKRIETVLRVRELQEQLARQEVIRARTFLSERERDEQVARADVDLRADAQGATTGSALADRRHMLGSGVVHASRLAERTNAAAEEVEGAMVVWRADAQRLDGIERLAERALDEERVEAGRQEAALVDDLVIARWGRGGTGATG